MNALGAALLHVPCGVAAWAGGALTGRELESGTAELARTQSVSPARWLTAKLALAALPLVTGSAVLAVAFDRVWSGDRDVLVTDWTWDRVFVPRGPLLPALVLFALATGVLTGLVLRRTLPALGAALAVAPVLRTYRASCGSRCAGRCPDSGPRTSWPPAAPSPRPRSPPAPRTRCCAAGPVETGTGRGPVRPSRGRVTYGTAVVAAGSAAPVPGTESAGPRAGDSREPPRAIPHVMSP